MKDHDELSALEAELQRLRPRALPPSLASRLERPPPAAPEGMEPAAVAAPVRVATFRPWRWASAGLAAALALAAWWWLPSAGDPPAPSTVPALASDAAPFKPVAGENLLLATADEGVVELADGTSARRIRLDYLDTYTWRDDAGASLEWSVPREVYYYVPIVAY